MLTKSEREQKAADIVKIAIVCSIYNSCGAKEDEINNIVTLYLRAGRIMRFLLYRSLYLSAGLLFLFLGKEQSAPSLDISSVEPKLNNRETLLELIAVHK